jgi:hypothetical protein
VCAFLVHLETGFLLFLGIDKELAKGQIQQSNRTILAFGNTENRMQKAKLILDILLWNSKKACK